MDTRLIESFICVVDQGSMAAAARRLHITPAAIAQRIQALEQEIGASLLVRSGRTVRPTEAGAAILAKARSFVKEVRELRALATGGETAGELRIGAISTAMTGLLPDMLAALIAAHPKVEVYVLPGTSVDLYRKVLEGELDAALLVKPPFALPKSCEWRTLREEPLMVLAPADAAAREPHHLLGNEPFIRYDRNHWGGQLGDDYLRRAGIRTRDRFELDALEAIATLVDRGLGVSLVPDWAPPWPAGLSIVKKPVPLPCEPRRVGMLWTRGSPRLHLVQRFVSEALR